MARARNLGIGAARGHWIAFLDDDDLWSPDKLRRQIDAAGAANAGFVYASAVIVDDGLRVRSEWPAPPSERLESVLLVRNALPAGASNVVVKAPLLDEVGAFDERLTHLADWDLWIRLARNASAASCPQRS